jgi:hypothetical protein
MQRLYIALHSTLSSYLRDVLHEGSSVLMLWHAFMFLGLLFFPLFFFLLGGPRCVFL